MYCEGRHVHQDSLQNTYEKNNGFFVKNPWTFDEKVGRSSVHSKYRENNCRGTPIFEKKKHVFFANLGVPGGTQKSWKLAAHFGQKPLKTIDPSKIVLFRFGRGFWLIFGVFGGAKRVPRRPFLAIFPPTHHLPHSLHPSSQNPFKLYTFNPTQPQKEPTTPKP